MKNLTDLLDRPIAFHRVFVVIAGGVLPALMLSQAFYWSKRTEDPLGWFWKTQAEWEEETGMGRREQETARARLRQTRFWQEDLRGIPAKVHFRVGLDLLAADLLGRTCQTSMAESAKHITESTPKITAETTAETTHIEDPGVCDGPLGPSSGPGAEVPPDTGATLTENPAGQGELVDPVEAVFQAALRSGQEIRNPAAYRRALIKAAARGELVAPIPVKRGLKPDLFERNRRAGAEWAAKMKTWLGYVEAYKQRYGVEPVQNTHTERQIEHLMTRLDPNEAPQVAAWYVGHNGAFYVRMKHPIDFLVKDCEGLRTEWARGCQVTDQDARHVDRRQATMNAFSPLLKEAEREARSVAQRLALRRCADAVAPKASERTLNWYTPLHARDRQTHPGGLWDTACGRRKPAWCLVPYRQDGGIRGLQRSAQDVRERGCRGRSDGLQYRRQQIPADRGDSL